jgi:type I restriction enzyme S subunit
MTAVDARSDFFLPDGWRWKRLKYVAKSPLKYGANEAAEFDDPDWPRFIRITDIRQDGSLRDDTFRSLPPAKSRGYELSAGDILLARSGATVGKSFFYLSSWGSACFAGYLIRLSTSDEYNARYIWWFLQSQRYWSEINSNLIQATIQNFSAEKYGQIDVPTPNLALQDRIADYLDRKTEQIDGLIAKKERLLELLAEKRQALITRAVTKGLNPDAPMQPSGIDWLGDTPAHWEVKRLRFLVNMASGATPPTAEPRYWDGGIPWVCPKDMKSELISSTLVSVSQEAIEEHGLRFFNQPHAVIVTRGMILAKRVPVAVAKSGFTVNQDMRVLQSFGTINPGYLRAYLKASESYLLTLVGEAGHGTRALRTDTLMDAPVLLPPQDEQTHLLHYIERKLSVLDQTIDETSRSLDRLTEYRSALITAAVTGQIEKLV